MRRIMPSYEIASRGFLKTSVDVFVFPLEGAFFGRIFRLFGVGRLISCLRLQSAVTSKPMS
jgi:hypothetical protein